MSNLPDPTSGRSVVLSKSHHRTWSDRAVETLTKLWTSGDYSAAQIARTLGVTRNAVLGKVHRLGLSGQRPQPVRRNPSPARPSRARRPRRLPPPSRPAFQPPPAQPVVEPVPEAGLTPHLEDLGPGTCHWPCGDPKADDFTFCGRRAKAGPYCGAHAARAFRPGVGGASLSALLRVVGRRGV